jgi:hypothetical protein
MVATKKLKKPTPSTISLPRRWAPTITLSEGVALPAVFMRLGHGQISTTVNRYSHVVLTDVERAADAIEISGRAKWR